MSHNEFRIDDVMPESALLLDDVAVFSGGDWLCATQAACTHRGGLLTTATSIRIDSDVSVAWRAVRCCTGAVLRGRRAIRSRRIRHIEGDTARIEDGQ